MNKDINSDITELMMNEDWDLKVQINEKIRDWESENEKMLRIE
jgi:hypothetical protein